MAQPAEEMPKESERSRNHTRGSSEAKEECHLLGDPRDSVSFWDHWDLCQLSVDTEH